MIYVNLVKPGNCQLHVVLDRLQVGVGDDQIYEAVAVIKTTRPIFEHHDNTPKSV